MGKLVLGILFVILLQVVFFGYTSRYWSTPNELDLARARPNPSESRPSPAPPAVTPPATEIVEPPTSPVLRKSETASHPRKVMRANTDSATRARRVLPRERQPEPTYSVLRRPRPHNEQLASVMPFRNTVILVDNLRPAPNKSRETDTAMPKKRSLLAKSFSVVVKKPWGWMKSLASKLN